MARTNDDLSKAAREAARDFEKIFRKHWPRIRDTAQKTAEREVPRMGETLRREGPRVAATLRVELRRAAERLRRSGR